MPRLPAITQSQHLILPQDRAAVFTTKVPSATRKFDVNYRTLSAKSITHLTFDCYGTLIDWEKGILAAVTPLFERVGRTVPAEAILRSFVAHEARLEAGSWRPYREILRAVLIEMAAELNLSLLRSESNLLGDLLPHWPPFPDTVSSLQSLSKQFHLVILSNTDDALFAETQKRLGVRFDEIITAEQVKSYKPGKAHFQEALRRLNVPASQVLHVAQSLYHDCTRPGAWLPNRLDQPSEPARWNRFGALRSSKA